MKYLLLFLALPFAANSQIIFGGGRNAVGVSNYGPTLPLTCKSPSLFGRTGATAPGIYFCSSANTWSGPIAGTVEGDVLGSTGTTNPSGACTAGKEIYVNTTNSSLWVCGPTNNNWIQATSGGSGDVTGPASSTNNRVALFDSTTGKVIKESTLTAGVVKSDSGVQSAAGASDLPTHASRHQHGGNDEVATATPAANAIPKAGSGGELATGWIPSLSANKITSDILDAARIPNLSASKITADQLALARGGTNQSTWTGGRCVQVSSDGTQLESASASCGSGSGGGDVVAPATNTDNYVPQWNGANSKTLKDGLPVATAATANTLAQRNASGEVIATNTVPTGKLPISVSSGAGAPSANCTAGQEIYRNTSNNDIYVCVATNTWQRVLTTNDSGVAVFEMLEGIAPGAGASAGMHNLYFDIADSRLKSHENGGSAVTYYSTANPQTTISGNAATASALAANGANCSTGQFPKGVDAAGAAEGCAALAATDIPAALSSTTSVNGTNIAASKTILYTDTAAGSFPTLNQNTTGNAATASAVAVGGITGLGTGVATFLATPSSENLAAALTDETGTGGFVLANSPILTTPNLGTPSAIVLTNGTGLPTAGLVDNAVTTAKASATMRTREIHWYVRGEGESNVVEDTQDYQSIWVNRLGSTITITDVWCECDTGSPTIQLQKDDGTPTNMLSSNLTCSSSGANTGTFVSGENVVANGNRVDYLTVSGSTATRISVHVVYTIAEP